MRPLRAIALTVLVLPLAACAASYKDINTVPPHAPVGAGVGMAIRPAPAPLAAAEPVKYGHPRSLHRPGKGLYHDGRARDVGDLLTIEIDLDESAALDNSSERSRESEIGLDVSLGFPNIFNLFGLTGGGGLTTGSTSSSTGEGAVDRSEALDLTLTAVVTRVLPNGNLVVHASQEVLVNHEMRVVNLAGIVRPRDVSAANSVAYQQVAEARLSYGGRGRITEVQQPPYGQQAYDLVTPF